LPGITAAGAGETTYLKTIVAGIEQAGGRVFGCAPSAGAAAVLRPELTADAGTLQQLLARIFHALLSDEATVCSEIRPAVAAADVSGPMAKPPGGFASCGCFSAKTRMAPGRCPNRGAPRLFVPSNVRRF